VPRSTLYSLTAAPRRRTCSIRVSSGRRTAPDRAASGGADADTETSKKDSAATLASATLPSDATTMTGCGSALSTGVGRRCRREGSTALMPRPLHAGTWSAKCVERLREAGLHDRGIGGGEHAPRCALRRCSRRARARGRSVERPAKVLARVAQPDIDAVVHKYFFVERADQRQLMLRARELCRVRRSRDSARAGRETMAALRRGGRPSPANRHPDAASAASASSKLSMSPLTTTEVSTRSL